MFFGDPEYMQRMQAEAEKRVDRMEAEADANMHETLRVLDSLNQEQATVVRKLLVDIRDTRGNEGLVANFWIGFLGLYLQTKYGICIACKKNHEHELLGAPTEEAS